MVGMFATAREMKFAVPGLTRLFTAERALKAIAASSLAHTRVVEMPSDRGPTSFARSRLYPLVYELLKEVGVDSTGRCNTVGFGCCPDRRCISGETGSSRRVVGGRQKGVVGAVEGRGVHKRHRPGSTESPRLYPRDDRGHRRLLSARAAQARMRAHLLRAGGDLPRSRCRRIPSCDRRSAGPARLHGVPGGKAQRRAQKLPGPEGRGASLKACSASEKVSARDR